MTAEIIPLAGHARTVSAQSRFRPRHVRLVARHDEAPQMRLGARVRHRATGRTGTIAGMATLPPSTRPLVLTIRWDGSLVPPRLPVTATCLASVVELLAAEPGPRGPGTCGGAA